jgi:hypothetical protein
VGSFPARVVDIADVPLLFRATDASRTRILEQFLAGFPAAVQGAEASVRLGARLPAVPRRRADHVVDGFYVWAAGTTMHVRLESSVGAEADETQAMIGIRVGFTHLFPAAFFFVVTHLLGLRDRFVVHAGALAHSGRAFLVLGGSGTGKSTLVGASLDSDWLPIADDMVVVRPGATGIELTGIRRAVAVPDDVGTRPGHEPMRGDPRRRWIVPPAALAPGWFPVAGVINVAHGASPSGVLAALDAHKALTLLMRSYPSVANSLLVRRFFRPASALARLPSWRLEHGSDPPTRLESARRLLDGVLAGAHGRT